MKKEKKLSTKKQVRFKKKKENTLLTKKKPCYFNDKVGLCTATNASLKYVDNLKVYLQEISEINRRIINMI